jgi:hypothetical protein
MADNQPETSNGSPAPDTNVTLPLTTTETAVSLPAVNLATIQQKMKWTKDQALERIRLIKYQIPVIPLPANLQQPVADFINTPDTAPESTADMSQQIRNATVPLNLSDSNDQGATLGSATILGVNDDRTKILLGSGVHSFLNMLDIDPTSMSDDDMIARAKEEIRRRLGQSFSDTDKLEIPLQDSSGNQWGVKDAKFIAVTEPDGSEQILLEVTLDEPLDQSFAPLAVANTQLELQQNSRILTGGYTPKYGYQQSLNGRVYSPELQDGVANDPIKDSHGNTISDPKGDDKKYNDIFLVTEVPGIQPGTSGGTVATINADGQLVYVGTITAKNNTNNVGWISSTDQPFVDMVNAWNTEN